MPNILEYTDSYKPTMHNQYEDTVVEVYSYIESRAGGKFPYTLFCGLQGFIKEWLLSPITKADVDEIETLYMAHFGSPGCFDRSIFDHIIDRHGGYLPLEICALPEGTIAPAGIPLVTVRNTDPVARSVTTYIETALLPAVWYPSTVATISRQIREEIDMHMLVTGADRSTLQFKLHDFGVRGASSFDSAAIGGVGHLLSFMGTDNVPALRRAAKYYHTPCAGFSIPAMEHSTVTSWGRDREAAAYLNHVQKNGHVGMVAAVSDSYDIMNAVSQIWGNELKSAVLNSGATVVVRPDSGDPVRTPIEVIERLDACYGHKVNARGFKVLNNVRVIQGDGIDINSIREILSGLLIKGFATDNIAFGMGGALLQHCDRDWGRWAMKCSQVTHADGRTVDVFKDPVGDKAKTSKRGKFGVREEGKSLTYYTLNPSETDTGLLTPVYRNGELLVDYSLDDIRNNSLKH